MISIPCRRLLSTTCLFQLRSCYWSFLLWCHHRFPTPKETDELRTVKNFSILFNPPCVINSVVVDKQSSERCVNSLPHKKTRVLYDSVVTHLFWITACFSLLNFFITIFLLSFDQSPLSSVRIHHLSSYVIAFRSSIAIHPFSFLQQTFPPICIPICWSWTPSFVKRCDESIGNSNVINKFSLQVWVPAINLQTKRRVEVPM